jgi:hypothetical protein
MMARAIINELHCFATDKDVETIAKLIARARDAAYKQGVKDGLREKSSEPNSR